MCGRGKYPVHKGLAVLLLPLVAGFVNKCTLYNVYMYII